MTDGSINAPFRIFLSTKSFFSGLKLNFLSNFLRAVAGSTSSTVSLVSLVVGVDVMVACVVGAAGSDVGSAVIQSLGLSRGEDLERTHCMNGSQ